MNRISKNFMRAAGLGCFFLSLMITESPATNPPAHSLNAPAGGSLRFDLQFAGESARVRLEIVWPDGESGDLEGVALALHPETGGQRVRVLQYRKADGSTKWSSSGTEILTLWPEEGSRQASAVGDLPARSIKTEKLVCVVRYTETDLRIWVHGRLVLHSPFRISGDSQLSFETVDGGSVLPHEAGATAEGGRFVPLELAHTMDSPGAFHVREIDGIPFEVPVTKGKSLSLAQAGWPEAEADPSFTSETYDGGAYFIGDPRMPLTQLPKADYVAAYLLARADRDESKSNVATLRIGRRLPGSRNTSQVKIFDFPAQVPRTNSPNDSEYQVVRVLLPTTVAPWIEDDLLDVELTKEIRLARRSPDPNRFRWRPLGLPSGVEILGVTMELSPIQMRLEPKSAGSLFAAATQPEFLLHLKNITSEPRKYEVDFMVDQQEVHQLSGVLAAGEESSQTITLPLRNPGYYELELALRNQGEEEPWIRHVESFGVLPHDRRTQRADAPWGTWDFTGMHFTSTDQKLVGELMHKLGLRYGMFNSDPEVRAEFGVVKGNLYSVRSKEENPQDTPAKYEEMKEKHPDLMPEIYIFHEDSISGPHVTRIPDLFHDRPPYKLDAEEQARFDKMWWIAEESAKAMRKAHPEVKLHLGNGPIPLREEFYRNKFPTELFDTGGNENPSFARIPESQPPDPVANNSSLWMDRQLLNHYGYGDKKVYQAHETIYPSTNPGNLSYQTQADYLVRNMLHSMVWGMPRIRPGIIADVGNSYYHSNWGSSGLMHRRPRITPKPAALVVAGLSSMLDGAVYEGFEDTGSESVYLLRFRKPDGSSVIPFWTVRGTRPLQLQTTKGSGAVLADCFGHEEPLELTEGVLSLTASSSPQYLLLPPGASIGDIELGDAKHPDSAPSGQVAKISSLDSLEGWQVITERDPILEFYNPMTPRRKGDFAFQPAGENEGLQLTPKPLDFGKETMPMYGGLQHSEGIALPGRPTEIGLQVKGNSGWGRIIFELEDASGQRWTSIGVRAKANAVWMADWLGEDLASQYEPGEISDWNTDDGWGLSRINFDGWRYVGFPLPGQYPGENYHWPVNSQWRSDGDGLVHYPLTLKKILIELPEKVLHLTRYEPPKNPSVQIKDLVVVEDDRNEPKQAFADYEERVQVTID